MSLVMSPVAVPPAPWLVPNDANLGVTNNAAGVRSATTVGADIPSDWQSPLAVYMVRIQYRKNSGSATLVPMLQISFDLGAWSDVFESGAGRILDGMTIPRV